MNDGQKSCVIAVRVSPKEKQILEKKVKELAAALNMPEKGSYGVTMGSVIKYTMWDSLKLLPVESINPNLVKLKRSL